MCTTASSRDPTPADVAATSGDVGGDPAIVARLAAGDPRAFELMVRTYGPRLLAVARRFLPNDADAADALQDAFLAAFRAIGRFEGHAALGTWLHRITVNAALMRLRTRRRRPETSIEALLPSFRADGHRDVRREAWRETPEELATRKETNDIVRAAISRLPEDYRIVLLLRDIEGLDTDETAAVLGIQAGAVKTRLHRARMALREVLETEFTP
ncbi:MAG: sigma-70 family RNA polymerase sigma factor [Phycisphaerae bacterium]|nr:sigma-70 family RNA polymerase sigma factor [Phycisphaerae bacterium]